MKEKILMVLLGFIIILILVNASYFLYQFYSWLFLDYTHSEEKVILNLGVLFSFCLLCFGLLQIKDEWEDFND